MNAIISVLFSAWTVVVCIVFLGVVLWAYSSRRNDEFAAAARLPLDADDEDPRIPGTYRSNLKEQV
ncbi:MAG: cbb3-type cytochrome oxidase subunit 3 [Gammaproteobacteria bacterium]